MRSTSQPSIRAQLREGGFAWTEDELGLGRATVISNGVAEVTFWHSVLRTEVREIPVAQLRAATLPPQTRVYSRHRDRWVVGRILERIPPAANLIPGSGMQYLVRFPNQTDLVLGEDAFEARCLSPVADPAGVLGAGGAESQFLFDRRQRAVQLMVTGRATTRALAGLLSASVHLLPHQLEVVRQVTDDPIQRYILADEVGLGKTIEACAVIRQALLDAPDLDVMVLAPDSLVAQWQAELVERFGMLEFEGQVEVLPHARLLEPPGRLPGMLVIDEVHRVVEDSAAPETYERLLQYARAVDRLLLLSATPVLNDAGASLRLLHLLDPGGYPLDDIAGFERRKTIRQELGRALLLLSSDVSGFAAKRAAAAVRQALHDDDTACALADGLLFAATAGSASSIIRARAQLKDYLSDAYRINRRLLRTRRRDLHALGLMTRRTEVTVEVTEVEGLQDMASAIEDWRYAAASQIQGEYVPIMAERYVRLAHALGTSVTSLAEEAETQLGQLDPNQHSTFAEDRDLLSRIAKLATSELDDECAEYVAEVIRYAIKNMERRGTRTAKVVVFSSSTAFARKVEAQLPRLVGFGSTFVVDRVTDRSVSAKAIAEFRDLSRPGVLLCDRAGEEGLNLQFADAVLHLDLPYEFMRIEQRIGRLDRIGRSQQQILQRVLLPSDAEGDPWSGWADLVEQSLGVFEESVADLQLVADDLTGQLKLRLFQTGSLGPRDFEWARHQVVAERERLDEEYALDRVGLVEVEGDESAARLISLDSDDASLARAFDGWWREVLHLGRYRSDQTADIFTLVWTERTLVPVEPWFDRIESSLDRPLTFDRELAAEGLEASLVRSGRSIVDVLPSILRYDDRGTAFATWRYVPEWAHIHGEWTVFRLGFVIEVDLETQGDAGKRHPGASESLRRRLDALVPPWLDTVYVDSDLRPIGDGSLLEILGLPYDADGDGGHRRDFNLGSRPRALAERLPPDQMADLSQRAAQRARDVLMESDDFRVTLEARRTSAASTLEVLEKRLERRERANVLQGINEPSILEERSQIDVLRALCSRIGPRLDSAGLFIIAASPPQTT